MKKLLSFFCNSKIGQKIMGAAYLSAAPIIFYNSYNCNTYSSPKYPATNSVKGRAITNHHKIYRNQTY